MTKPKSLYLGGPMRGYPQYNFPEFDRVAAILRESGYQVVSPAEMDRELGFDETTEFATAEFIEEAMARDFEAINQVDAVVFMEGWDKSVGCAREKAHAESVGKPVYTYVDDKSGGWVMTEVIPPKHHALDEEVRVVDDSTGGAKGAKLAELGAVDPRSLMEVAQVAGFGGRKYERYNFAKGYRWSLSFDALMRHLLAFWGGEVMDQESGLPHMAHAAWHCLALQTFSREGLGSDDRFPYPEWKPGVLGVNLLPDHYQQQADR